MTRAPLPPDLAHRATAARQLLARARRTLEAGGPFAPSFALLELRDAAGLLLGVAAEHLGVGPGVGGESTPGDTAGGSSDSSGEEVATARSLTRLASAIDQAAEAGLTHRPALERLEQGADAFLRCGDSPEPDDVRRLGHDLESFFAETLRAVLETDGRRLAPRSLVDHCRAENWLRRAEEALAENDASEAVRASAAALAVFRRHLDGAAAEDSALSEPTAGDGADPRLAALSAQLDRQRQRLDLVMDGVDLTAYRRFQTLAPDVALADDGEIRFAENAPEVGRDDATFCHAFVLDTLISLRAHHPRSAAGRDSTNVVLRATRETPILVSPGPGGEEIRRVSAGEVLKTHRAGEPHEGHLPIVVDGDPAWVDQGAVEEIG